MPALQLLKFEEIIERMISRVVVRSDLSDVTDTSGFKHVLAACAREIDEAYYQLTRLRDTFDLQKAAGEDLDERAKEIQPGTMKRVQARRAVGQVLFSRISTIGDITIANGTVLKTKDGKVFKTTLQGSILSGQNDSELIPITAVTAGSDGNTVADTIIVFSSKIPGVDSVTNPAGTTQGRNIESDDEFRSRLRSFVASLARSTVQALEFAAVGAEDPDSGKQVIFAHLFEDPLIYGKTILYIDDGAGTAATLDTPITGEVVIASAVGGEEFLTLQNKPIDIITSTLTVTSDLRGELLEGTQYFINPASGVIFFSPALSTTEEITADYTPYVGLIPVVQKIIDGDLDDRANFPGYRAGGVFVEVLSPNVISIPIEASLTLDPETDRETAIVDAKNAILDYVNNLGISANIIRNEIIQRLMEVTGVTDLILVLPIDNTNVLDNEIPRISESDLLIT